MNPIKQNLKNPVGFVCMLLALKELFGESAAFNITDLHGDRGKYGSSHSGGPHMKKGYHKGCFGSPRFKGYKE